MLEHSTTLTGPELADRITGLALAQLGSKPGVQSFLAAFLGALAASHPPARLCLCGGAVRDCAAAALDGHEVAMKDVDVVLEGVDAEAVEGLLVAVRTDLAEVEWFDRVGASFPVWKIKVDGEPEPVDLALVRTERSFGSGHRDFTVETAGVTLEEDSRRRDFTVNALFVLLTLDEGLHLAAEVLDFHDGLGAMLRREIACVGAACERFAEDPLRMLRAVRFQAQLPGFRIVPTTADAIAGARALLGTVSPERFAAELDKMLRRDACGSLTSLLELGVLDELLPEMSALGGPRLERTGRRVTAVLAELGPAASPQVVFAALLTDLGLDDVERRARRRLGAARVEAAMLGCPSASEVARRLRLPDTRRIARLLETAMVFLWHDLLVSRDAVLEQALDRPEVAAEALALYRACRTVDGVEARDLVAHAAELRPRLHDFGQVLRSAGVPSGPHLQDLKLALRQAEISGRIRSPDDAMSALDWLYASHTHLVREHVAKVVAAGTDRLPGPLRGEARWLLFTRPVLLLGAYDEAGVLAAVLPELTEMEQTVDMTEYHYCARPLAHILAALALLEEEVGRPTPTQVLATLLLDAGKPDTKGVDDDGRITYYGHGEAGVEVARRVCRRLEVGEPTAGDVAFIVRNSAALITNGAINRARRLTRIIDRDLFTDLMVVHKVDQTAKMRVEHGRRVDEGQLDLVKAVDANLDAWMAEAERRRATAELHRLIVSGTDLMADDHRWGPGLSEGPAVGRLKARVAELREKGLIFNREQALDRCAGWVILHHLVRSPADYLAELRRRGLLEALLPEIAALVAFDQSNLHHTEDVFDHTVAVVRALPEEASEELRLAAVFHDVGKAETRSWDEGKRLFHCYGHEAASARLFTHVCERFAWSTSDLDVDQVTWLVRNHQKVHHRWEWASKSGARRRAMRLFFGSGDATVPEVWRRNLLALTRADILGASPVDPEITTEKLVAHDRIAALVDDIECQTADEAHERAAEHLVRSIWNGHAVMDHFAVRGADIGRLVAAGQALVRTWVEEGREHVSEDAVAEALRKQT